ncbi:MAG: hypothetical protein ABJA86_07640 [Nocardioidaceae bacterium]
MILDLDDAVDRQLGCTIDVVDPDSPPAEPGPGARHQRVLLNIERAALAVGSLGLVSRQLRKQELT